MSRCAVFESNDVLMFKVVFFHLIDPGSGIFTPLVLSERTSVQYCVFNRWILSEPLNRRLS